MPRQALDGRLVTIQGTVSLQTRLVDMLLAGNHLEQIQLHILGQPGLPCVLGFPWLCRHNPPHRLGDRNRSWVGSHLSPYMLEQTEPPRVPSTTDLSPDLAGVPPNYHNLHQVFSKARATSLPPQSLRLFHKFPPCDLSTQGASLLSL